MVDFEIDKNQTAAARAKAVAHSCETDAAGDPRGFIERQACRSRRKSCEN
jgi:hypothetical protein